MRDDSKDYEHYGSGGSLWARFGCDAPRTTRGCTGHKYASRNALMSLILGMAKPRHVFEFAGNGGFMMQRALNTPSVHARLESWLHSDFAFGAVEYAVAVVSNNSLLGNMTMNVDSAVRARRATGWRAMVPFSKVLKKDDMPLIRDEVNLTVMQIDIRKCPLALQTFDLVATISFEHIQYDLELIQQLKAGTVFVFGVATFSHAEHHRHFTNATQVRTRYCEWLNVTGVYLAAPFKVVVASVRSETSTCGDNHHTYSRTKVWDLWHGTSRRGPKTDRLASTRTRPSRAVASSQAAAIHFRR